MKKLKTLTLNDIRALEPCYNPARYLPEDWTGTVVDILETKACPPQDRIWVATHFLPDSINRHFAVLVANRALDEYCPEAVDCYAATMLVELRALGAEVPQEDINAAAAVTAAVTAAWVTAAAAWAAAAAVSAAGVGVTAAAAWAAAGWAAWEVTAAAEQVELLLWLSQEGES